MSGYESHIEFLVKIYHRALHILMHQYSLYTVKAANILQQTLNPEANVSKSCCARVRVSFGNVYTMHVYCYDVVIDLVHRLSIRNEVIA